MQEAESVEFTDLPDLASELLKASIIFATDEWFAEADNLLKIDEPLWDETRFTTYGKWMDGWESRRRRTAGHDWCIIKLGIPGNVIGIDIDTAYFTGNYPPHASVQAACLDEVPAAFSELEQLRKGSRVERVDGRMGLCASERELELATSANTEEWEYLLPVTRLGAGYAETRHNFFTINGSQRITHIRLNQHPDGGIARFRVYGVVSVNHRHFPVDVEIDLAAVEHGGRSVAVSNKHYGHPRNLLMPGRGKNMGEGWETARQLTRPPVYKMDPESGLIVLPGKDWTVIRLALTGNIRSIEIDTNWYKGNYPESVQIDSLLGPNLDDNVFKCDDGNVSLRWAPLLPRSRLGPNSQFVFSVADGQLKNVGPVSHVRITIFPDGGIMRLRVRGTPWVRGRL